MIYNQYWNYSEKNRVERCKKQFQKLFVEMVDSLFILFHAETDLLESELCKPNHYVFGNIITFFSYTRKPFAQFLNYAITAGCSSVVVFLFDGYIIIKTYTCISWTLDISWYDITRYRTQYTKFEGKTLVRLGSHGKHPYTSLALMGELWVFFVSYYEKIDRDVLGAHCMCVGHCYLYAVFI